MRRLLLLVVVACGLAPGTWLRSPPPPIDTRQELTLVGLPDVEVDLGPFELLGAWWLQSPNSHFGSYSGLVALDDGTLQAASDRGRILRFAPPGEPLARPLFGFFGRPEGNKLLVDIEALTRDPQSGRIWAAYEGSNRIARYDAGLAPAGEVSPAAMASWPANSGPEAMVRLNDGRFIVLGEGDPAWFGEGTPGLAFAGDPVEGAAAQPFRFVAPDGYSAVDMAQMPDGTVLILLRRVEWGLPPRFVGKLVFADPAGIGEGRAWAWREAASLADPLPMDNYEGLAVDPIEGGGAIVWLISDDNQMRYQRTLLLKLVWRPGADKQKAHGSPARLQRIK